MRFRSATAIAVLVCASCSFESRGPEEAVGVARADILLAPNNATCIVMSAWAGRR